MLDLMILDYVCSYLNLEAIGCGLFYGESYDPTASTQHPVSRDGWDIGTLQVTVVRTRSAPPRRSGGALYRTRETEYSNPFEAVLELVDAGDIAIAIAAVEADIQSGVIEI